MVDIHIDALIDVVRPDVVAEIERRAVARFVEALHRQQRQAIIAALENLRDLFRQWRIKNQIHDQAEPCPEPGTEQRPGERQRDVAALDDQRHPLP